MRKLQILFAFFSLILCEKLSESEDQERVKQCGQPGKDSTGEPSWAVQLRLTSTQSQPNGGGTPAVLVSKRHVLAAGWNAIGVNNQTKEWEWIDGKAIELRTQCKDDVIQLPKHLLKNYKIHLSTCKNKDLCGTSILRNVVLGHYIGICDPELGIFGVILLEISYEVPSDVDYFRPVCVSSDKKSPDDGTAGELQFYSTTDNVIRKTSGKTVKCTDSRRLNSMLCASNCGSGSLSIKDGEKETAIGISMENENNQQCGQSKSVSTGYYRTKICDLAGICRSSSTRKSPATCSLRFAHLLVIVAVLAWRRI